MVIIFNAKIIDNAGIFSARKDQLLNFEKCYYVIATNRDYQAYLYPTFTENMHLTAAPSLSLGKVKSAYEPSGPSGRSLSRFL